MKNKKVVTGVLKGVTKIARKISVLENKKTLLEKKKQTPKTFTSRFDGVDKKTRSLLFFSSFLFSYVEFLF